MDKLANQLDLIGLTDLDVEEKIESTDDIVNCVSSSTRLFRKTLKHIILREIKLYFSNDGIGPSDELILFFPKKDRRTEWVKFTYYFDLKIPRLKLNKFAISLLTINILSVLTFTFWLIFGQTELIIHSLLSKMSVLPAILFWGLFPTGLIVGLGSTVLPVRTIDELLDEIISVNFADLLYDDKKKFKEIIIKELIVE